MLYIFYFILFYIVYSHNVYNLLHNVYDHNIINVPNLSCHNYMQRHDMYLPQQDQMSEKSNYSF